MSGTSRTRPGLLDAAIAASVMAYAEFELLTARAAAPVPVLVIGGVLIGLPLAWRRSHPWPMLLVVFGTFWALFASDAPRDFLAGVVAALTAVYSFQTVVGTASAWLGFGFAYGTLLVTAPRPDIPNTAGWMLILIGGASIVGRAMRSRRLLIERLGETTEALRRSRDENARAAVARERVHIARELHDVVAHAVSMMIVQAGAAERVLSAEPQQAEEPLRAVQQAGRQALAELRRLLGVLRPDGDHPASLTPQPGMADLTELANRFHEAGLLVNLVRNGEGRELPAGIELAAYRVIQDALTNVLKHSGTTTADVQIDYGAEVLELEVSDQGTNGATKATSPSTGHGLLGMRERVAAYGGHLDAGPGPEGGYSVRVMLPIPAQ